MLKYRRLSVPLCKGSRISQATQVSPSVETSSTGRRNGIDSPVPGGYGHHRQEYGDLKRLISWVLATLILLTLLTVLAGILSRSLAISAVAVDAGTSLVLHLFNIITIGIILRQNSFSYPYGTGKLENFSGFLYAALVMPGALLIIVSAVKRYLHPPAAIDFGPAQVMLILWLIRDLFLLFHASRIRRRYPDHSPMTESYFVNMKVTVTYSAAILAGLLFGSWMTSTGRPGIAVTVDLIIAVLVVAYMCYCAAGLLVRNFRSLIDMPLPETDQYKILNALTADFDSYEGIGNIYSQLSGSTRLIQIEIYFDPSTTAEEMDRLRDRIEERLRGHFNKLLFHLIPLVRKPWGSS
jgi:cation diffusion facilitator family transporter